MEVRTSLNNGQGVFSDLLVEDIVGLVVHRFDCVEVTHADTASAAHAAVVIDMHFVIFIEIQSAVSTDLLAHSAAAALLRIDLRFGAAVHFHLSSAGTAAHADILQRTAEARGLMTLEMSHRNEDVRIHDRPANFRFLHVFLMNWNQDLVRAFQPVSDQDVTAAAERIVAILIR